MTTRLLLIALALNAVPHGAIAAERTAITTERGTCIPGPHERGRIEKLPGTPVMSRRHREANEDAYVHCRESTGTTESGPNGSEQQRVRGR